VIFWLIIKIIYVTSITGYKKVTIVLDPQLANTAMLVAFPRASDLNNSAVINQGIAPN
jgi:hypothetical protein